MAKRIDTKVKDSLLTSFVKKALSYLDTDNSRRTEERFKDFLLILWEDLPLWENGSITIYFDYEKKKEFARLTSYLYLNGKNIKLTTFDTSQPNGIVTFLIDTISELRTIAEVTKKDIRTHLLKVARILEEKEKVISEIVESSFY